MAIFDEKPLSDDYYLPADLAGMVRDCSREKLADLRQRFDGILSGRGILESRFSSHELLEGYRQSLLERLNELAENREKVSDLCAMFYDVLDPALAFPVIMQKLAQMGDGVVDLIAIEDAGKRLLDSLENDYAIWMALHEGEAIAEAVRVQEEMGRATAATSRSLSKERIESAIIRLFPEEYRILNDRLSFVRRSVETIASLRDLVRMVIFNLQKVGDWLARQEKIS